MPSDVPTRRASRWLAGETAAGRHMSLTAPEYSLIGFHSDTGKKPAPGGGLKRINQDTAMTGLLGVNNDLLFSVFDGHGATGRRVSRTVCRSVHTSLVEAADDVDKAAVLKKALPAADEALNDRHGHQSGTTAIVAVLQQAPTPRVIVACVGDSRCILGRPSRSGFLGMGKDGPWEAVALSVDQKPDEPAERARIEAAGGLVTGGGESGEPARVWRYVDGGKMGVAVARSVGDHAMRDLGVHATPEVSEIALESTDACLILGSDGIWDMVTNERAVGIAQAAYPDAREAAAKLIRIATKRWRKEEANYRDDISVIVCYLHGPDGAMTPNEGVARQLAAFGPDGLGANFEYHEDEEPSHEEAGGDDDDETAESESESNEDGDEAEGGGGSPNGAMAADEQTRADPLLSARHFNRRLTTVMPEQGQPLIPQQQQQQQGAGGEKAEDGNAPPPDAKDAKPTAAPGKPGAASDASAAPPASSTGGGGCCVIA